MIKLRKFRQSPEHLEQSAFVQWLDLIGRSQYQIVSWFAIPNGGLRNLKVAVKLKKEGVRAGVPDFFIAQPSNNSRNYYSGLFLEFKHGKNKQTEQQKEWFSMLRTYGYCCRVVFSADEAIDITMKYMRGEL